jgi:hypothetical protein
MRPPLVLPLVLAAAAACAACGPAPGSGSPSASTTGSPSPGIATATAPAAETPAVRIPLPSGFPVLEGAAPEAMPDDDPGLIGLWSSDRLGSAAYDFYVTGLPAAGYPIIGLYPGGGVAQIRFAVPDGAVWQMVAYGGSNGRVTIEIRQDRP